MSRFIPDSFRMAKSMASDIFRGWKPALSGATLFQFDAIMDCCIFSPFMPATRIETVCFSQAGPL
ncbi:hypothetical protein [Marimonas lutisalis]|uniref:hypothetical protein n=1 Tax=Marimonas lutisalis TaxID=2545756 RepID=UPI001961503E|nr:hypothetical protein [Marimonas lutisalis]